MLGVKVPNAAVTVTVPLPVPEAGATLSQEALSLADHARVPPPVLLSVMVCAAGLLPPCCAVKARLVGLAPIAGVEGGGGVTGGVVGERSCESPGIASMSLCMPLPPPELLPVADDPVAAVPTAAVGADEVWPVGPERAPANDAEVVIVVVDGAVLGATARGAFKFVVVVVVVESFV